MPAVRLVLPTPPLPFAIATTRLTCHTLHIHSCVHPDPTPRPTGDATPHHTGSKPAVTAGAASPSPTAARHDDRHPAAHLPHHPPAQRVNTGTPQAAAPRARTV